MPTRCGLKDSKGYFCRWGGQGKKYYYKKGDKESMERARKKADAQGAAAHASGYEGAYDCECIECGYKIKSEEHCADIKCPECGGQMRRIERPGIGRKSLPNVKPKDIENIRKSITAIKEKLKEIKEGM